MNFMKMALGFSFFILLCYAVQYVAKQVVYEEYKKLIIYKITYLISIALTIFIMLSCIFSVQSYKVTQKKLDQYINVEKYNIVIDTNDIEYQIQKAINTKVFLR